MPRIRAAVAQTFDEPLGVQEVELAVPRAGKLGVTLDAVAICHSDISYAEGAWGGTLPAVFGHEAAGRVTALGDGVQGVSLGDAVVVKLIRACGTCASCASGRRPTVFLLR